MDRDNIQNEATKDLIDQLEKQLSKTDNKKVKEAIRVKIENLKSGNDITK